MIAAGRPFLLVLVALLAGCAGDGGPSQVDITHVHGLACSGTSLYVATHHGLAKRDAGGDWAYVGDGRDDLMGFSQDAGDPETFYASGHPSDPYAYGATSMGLRRSTDGARTWQDMSLKGQADFHALTALREPGHVAAFWQGNLKVSDDGGATWTDHATDLVVLGLAASDTHVWAATTTGVWRTADMDAWERVAQDFANAVAVSPDGQVIVAGQSSSAGYARLSQDAGATWRTIPAADLATAMGMSFAVCAQEPDRMYAATPGGQVAESRDAGATWQVIRAA